MGYNLIWECTEHNQFAYSMRGEEGHDFQWIARKHRKCFEDGKIKVHMDCDTTIADEDSGLAPMWEYEQRPYIVGFR